MDQTLEYLTECGVFFVAAAGPSGPHVEPLTRAGWYDGALYILVDRTAPLYRALRLHPEAEIAAVHPDKSWISIRGRLEEDLRPDAAEALLAGSRKRLVVLEDRGDAPFRLTRGRAAVHALTGKRSEWTVP